MDERTAKEPGSQMSAPAIQSGIDWNLHHFARPVYSEVSTPAERPRDVEAEVGGQRPADAEVGSLRSGGQKPADTEAGGLRSGGQRGQVRSSN